MLLAYLKAGYYKSIRKQLLKLPPHMRLHFLRCRSLVFTNFENTSRNTYLLDIGI